MAKRIQQESGEEGVTAKSRPMINLIARMPSVVSSSTSSSPVKRWYGKQDPWKSFVVDDRSGQPDRLSPVGYSKLDYDRSWSSQEWKSEVTAHDRSGKPDKTSWNAVQQVRPHHGDTLLDGDAAEFANKVKDQVRKRHKKKSNVADPREEHSIICGMSMVATMNAATFMG